MGIGRERVMRKYIVLVLAICILAGSGTGLYIAYAPRTGPLGNGPDHGWIWWNFTISFGMGLLFLVNAIVMFKQRKNE
jgi:hypothetical protein